MAACEPPETCQDGLLGPLDPEQCQVLGEGCVCSEGTLLHRRHSALCVPQEKCGRFFLYPGGALQSWPRSRVSSAHLLPMAEAHLHSSRATLGMVSVPGRV